MSTEIEMRALLIECRDRMDIGPCLSYQELDALTDRIDAALSQQPSAVDECKEPGRCCPACGRCYGCARPVLDCLAGIRAAPKSE